jgi:hypothetical protein
MFRRLLTLAVAPLAAGCMLVAATPGSAGAATAPTATTNASTTATRGTLVQNVTGTVNGVATTGTLTITKFVQQGSQLLAVGTLTLGGVNLGTVQVPINTAASSGSCQILHLVLGPLDLNLLGLQIHLNQVVLDITAQQGPGNLLGNLLCAIAGLLDNGSTTALAQLLNQLLALLGL